MTAIAGFLVITFLVGIAIVIISVIAYNKRLDKITNGEVHDTHSRIPEPGTTAFESRTTVVKKKIENFAPGDVTKFTVVIWLEGNDVDCVDTILGGEFKIDMTMSILNVGEAD